MVTSLDDLPIIGVVEEIAGHLRTYWGRGGVDLLNFALVAKRYSEPAQKALVHVVEVAPGCQLEQFSAFVRAKPWAANSIHHLALPSLPSEIAYISGAAALGVLRVGKQITNLKLGLPARELVRCVAKFRNSLRKLRLVHLELYCLTARAADPTPVELEQAALDFAATSRLTLRVLRFVFGMGTRTMPWTESPQGHAAVDRLDEPFGGELLKMRRLKRLEAVGASMALMTYIAGISPTLRFLAPGQIASLEAFDSATLGRLCQLRLSLPWLMPSASAGTMFRRLTHVHHFIVDSGVLDLYAVPPSVRKLQLDDQSVEPMALAARLIDPGWLPRLQHLTYSCSHSDEDEDDEEDMFMLNHLSDEDREDHDNAFGAIEDAADSRGITHVLY